MSKKKLSTLKEEYEEKVAETVDMITTEDLVEQAVYVAHAPVCCSNAEQADNMLNMLGANIIDDDIYHTPEEHSKLEM